MQGAGGFCVFGRLHQRLAVIADQLCDQWHSSGRTDGFFEVVFGQMFTADAADTHELGENHVGPNPVNKQRARRAVGQTLQWGQHEWLLFRIPGQRAQAMLCLW